MLEVLNKRKLPWTPEDLDYLTILAAQAAVAIESAQLTLLHGDFSKVLKAIKLSRFTMSTVKQNLFWAFIYNTIGIPLAATGILTPAFSAGAMAFQARIATRRTS